MSTESRAVPCIIRYSWQHVSNFAIFAAFVNALGYNLEGVQHVPAHHGAFVYISV